MTTTTEILTNEGPAEIAAQMDTTAKAVEGLLGRARNELRTLMNESLIS